jgi:hypothetical protein
MASQTGRSTPTSINRSSPDISGMSTNPPSRDSRRKRGQESKPRQAQAVVYRGTGRWRTLPIKKGPDLTGFLTFEEKNAIVSLMTSLTDKMQRNLSLSFDSPPVTPATNEYPQNTWLSLPLMKENVVPIATNSKESVATTATKGPRRKNSSRTCSKAREILEKEENEAMTPHMQELKKEAITSFKKWQNIVLQRVRDIIVKEPETLNTANSESLLSCGGRGRGASEARGARGQRGGRASRGGRGLPPFNPALRNPGKSPCCLSINIGSYDVTTETLVTSSPCIHKLMNIDL